jgi:putative ABC transport system permease protein
MSWLSRIANVFRSRSVDRDIDAELESHFDEARAAGRDPTEISREFGSRLRAHEAVRDVLVAPWLESLVADTVFGWRQLLKHKAASAAAVLSLALGIGACTAAFRLIDALFLRPLPVADPGSLYVLSYGWIEFNGTADINSSLDYPSFRVLRAAVKDQAELMAISPASRIDITYGSDQEMERVYRQYVSGWTFAEFGLRPAVGRLFTEADDLKPGAHPYAVISYDYWSRRFGKDPHIVGQTFRNGNDLYRIVGVAPPGFTGTETGMVTDLFVPTMMNARGINGPGMLWLRTWVRVRPGAEPEIVRQRLRSQFLAYRREEVKSWPPNAPKREREEYVSAPVLLEPAAAGFSALQKTYRRALAILGVLVCLVLLIACANVANLMTAQAAARVREMALRVSIGAGKRRLVQLVLMESALLALIASTVGIVFAWWAAPFVVGMINPPDDPARLVLPADWRVTIFAVALTFAVTLLFGLAPALRASAVKPASALKGGDDPHTKRRLMHGLVAVQVAFCFLVHFVAGLFIFTFERLANQPTGFSSARVLTLETVSNAEQPAAAWYEVLDHVRALPGVESAAVAQWALMMGGAWIQPVWANGHSPEEYPSPPLFLGVSPGWFETMKIALLDGRDFRSDDTFPHVAAVNEAFARRYFDGRNPVGQTFQIKPEGRTIALQIVAYVRDAHYAEMRVPVRATAYVPFGNMSALSPQGTDRATFLVRSESPNPMALASMLRREIPRARSELRVSNVVTQEELVRDQTIRERMLATLSLFFAAVALVLAGVGLYGVLDYAVVGRRRELGIRIALGARNADIARRVTIEVFSMLVLGAVCGLALGLGSARYIATLLYQVKATDAPMLALPVVTILSAALLAALPPVLRAIHIDPSEMLRAE